MLGLKCGYQFRPWLCLPNNEICYVPEKWTLGLQCGHHYLGHESMTLTFCRSLLFSSHVSGMVGLIATKHKNNFHLLNVRHQMWAGYNRYLLRVTSDDSVPSTFLVVNGTLRNKLPICQNDLGIFFPSLSVRIPMWLVARHQSWGSEGTRVKMWHARGIQERNLYSCFEKGDWATLVIHSSGTRMVSVILISCGTQGLISLTQPVVPWQLMSWDPFCWHG